MADARVIERRDTAATCRSSSSRHCTARQPCPGAGTIIVDAERRGVRRGEPQPREAGRGQHRRVDLALPDLAQPRVDVAAQVDDLDGPGSAARSWARRRSADVPIDGPRPEPLAVPRRPSTSRGSARSGTAPIMKSLVVLGRQVLRRVHGQVDLAGSERLEDRVDPQALQPLRRAVGAGPSSPDGASSARSSASTRSPSSADPDVLGLREGQRRAARPDPQGAHDGGVEVDPEEVGQQPGVRPVRAGLAALLQLDDRVVQELGGDASGERLDGLALVGCEVGQPRAVARPARRARRRRRGAAARGSAARARRRGAGPRSGAPPRPRCSRARVDLAGGLGVVLGERARAAPRRRSRGRRRRRLASGSTSRGTARSTSTRGRSPRPPSRRARPRRRIT